MPTQLSILLPLLDGHAPALLDVLRAIPVDGGPFSKVPGTHNGRFALIDTSPSPTARMRAGGLKGPMLMCSATIDVEPAAWLRSFLDALGPLAEAVWSHCPDWSLTVDRVAFLLEHRVHPALEFATWDAPVDRIQRALDVHRRLSALAVRMQAADPAELLAAYRAEMGG
jgi:hypothetical protein